MGICTTTTTTTTEITTTTTTTIAATATTTTTTTTALSLIVVATCSYRHTPVHTVCRRSVLFTRIRPKCSFATWITDIQSEALLQFCVFLFVADVWCVDALTAHQVPPPACFVISPLLTRTTDRIYL
jgi:hypothetical protein